MPINPTRSTKDVYGDNLFADLMDFFLVNEPTDLLRYLPPGIGGASPAAGATAGIIERGAIPAETKALQELARKGTAKKLGSIFAKIEDALKGAAEAPKVGPLDPKEMLKRRFINDTPEVPSLSGNRIFDALGNAVLFSPAFSGAVKHSLDSFANWANSQIDQERQRKYGSQ